MLLADGALTEATVGRERVEAIGSESASQAVVRPGERRTASVDGRELVSAESAT